MSGFVGHCQYCSIRSAQPTKLSPIGNCAAQYNQTYALMTCSTPRVFIQYTYVPKQRQTRVPDSLNQPRPAANSNPREVPQETRYPDARAHPLASESIADIA